MTNPTIHVTGAAGKAAVVEQLIDKGFPMRALVRRADETSAGSRRDGGRSAATSGRPGFG